jgi:hypothetical protein
MSDKKNLTYQPQTSRKPLKATTQPMFAGKMYLPYRKRKDTT